MLDFCGGSSYSKGTKHALVGMGCGGMVYHETSDLAIAGFESWPSRIARRGCGAAPAQDSRHQVQLLITSASFFSAALSAFSNIDSEQPLAYSRRTGDKPVNMGMRCNWKHPGLISLASLGSTPSRSMLPGGGVVQRQHRITDAGFNSWSPPLPTRCPQKDAVVCASLLSTRLLMRFHEG